jgi:hypothetical protein
MQIDLPDQLVAGGTGEGIVARKQSIGHHAERPQIGLGAGAAAELFSCQCPFANKMAPAGSSSTAAAAPRCWSG